MRRLPFIVLALAALGMFLLACFFAGCVPPKAPESTPPAMTSAPPGRCSGYYVFDGNQGGRMRYVYCTCGGH